MLILLAYRNADSFESFLGRQANRHLFSLIQKCFLYSNFKNQWNDTYHTHILLKNKPAHDYLSVHTTALRLQIDHVDIDYANR